MTEHSLINTVISYNKKENRILQYDVLTNTLTVEIAAPPQNNKANKELISFLTKTFKKRIRIVSGLTSKKKICVVE